MGKTGRNIWEKRRLQHPVNLKIIKKHIPCLFDLVLIIFKLLQVSHGRFLSRQMNCLHFEEITEQQQFLRNAKPPEHNVAQQSCATCGCFQREPAEQLRSVTQPTKHLRLLLHTPNPCSTSTREHSSISRVTNEPELYNELIRFKLRDRTHICALRSAL